MDLFDDESLLKNKMEDHRIVDIPNELTWEQIGPAILDGVDKRKKKRRLLFVWWFFGISIIGISLLGWSLVHYLSQEELITAEIKSEVETTIDNNQINIPNSIEFNNSPNIQLNNQQQLTDYGNNKSDQIEIPSYVINHNINSAYFNTNLGTQHSQTKHNLNSTLDPQFDKEQKSTSVPFNEKLIKNVDNAIQQNIVAQARTVSPLVKLLPQLEFDQLLFNSELLVIAFNPIIHQPALNTWQLELTGGLNKWEQGFNPQVVAEQLNSSLIGWQLNARIVRKLGKNFTVKVGVNYQSLRFKSAFENTEVVNVFNPNTIDAVFTNSITGEESFSFRDSIPNVRTRNFQHFNSHASITLPILAGITFTSNRFNYSLHSGISLQVLRYSSGRISLMNGTVLELPDKNLYANRVRLALLLETQLSYQLTNKLHVINTWGIERYISNWTSSSFSLDQHPMSMTGSIGIAWSL